MPVLYYVQYILISGTFMYVRIRQNLRSLGPGCYIVSYVCGS